MSAIADEAMNKKHRERISIALKGKNTKEKNGMWKGGRIYDKTQSRWLIHKPQHPFATKKGYVYEHRLIMEKNINRYLNPEEMIHHLNGTRDDNRIENLIIIKQSEHMALHTRKYFGCKMKKCNKPHRSKGYCAVHYNKVYGYGGYGVS